MEPIATRLVALAIGIHTQGHNSRGAWTSGQRHSSRKRLCVFGVQ
jgi:hypothetical protein